MLKKLIILAVIAVLIYCGLHLAVKKVQGDGPEVGTTGLRFQEVELDHTHAGDLKASLPFMGMCAVDIDGDGVDEIFIGGGHGSEDALFRFSGDRFAPVAGFSGFDKAEKDATFGSASLDVTGDGLDDLFVARESGVYLFINQGGGAFEGEEISFGLADNTVPLSVALGDVDQDGDVDLYVSGYIKVELMEGQTNFDKTYGGYSYLLRNEGNNVFVDASEESGVFRKHNTFTAMFVDLDNDGWPDLTVAQDTGLVETWRNQGDGTFEVLENPTVYSFPMGIGAGDVDNDGDVDLYYSNVGRTLPQQLVKGNLTADDPFNPFYTLLRNDAGTGFTDVAEATGSEDLGFGWGVLMADFNNDSLMDLYAAQNYATFPGVEFFDLYPGRLLQQTPEGQFFSVEEEAGLTNKNFGVTQVVSDFNQDGWQDIVLGNVTGETRAFLSGGSHGASWLQVRLPDGAAALNSRVQVTMADGRELTRQLFASESFASDQTDVVHFGLGAYEGTVTVTVKPSGKAPSRVYENVPVNQYLDAY